MIILKDYLFCWSGGIPSFIEAINIKILGSYITFNIS